MLSESVITKVKPTGKRQIIRDNAGIAGFCFTVSGGGKRKFAMDYRLNGKRTTQVIGCYPAMTLSQARLIACQWRERIDCGLEPVEKKYTMSYEKVCDEYIKSYVKVLKESTRNEYMRHIAYLKGVLGDVSIDEITLPVVRDLHRGYDAPIQANRIVATLSSIIEFATDAGYRVDDRGMPLPNPCKAIKKNKENSRVDIVATKEQLMQMLDYMRVHESHEAYCYYLTLVVTAARAGEVDTMRWADINNGVWVKPKTKKGKAHRVKVSGYLLGELKKLPFNPAGLVHSFSNHRAVWDRARKHQNLRITRHDIRGSVATELINSGVSIEEISEMLGHSDVSVTRSRYAHLISDSSNAVSVVESMIQVG